MSNLGAPIQGRKRLNLRVNKASFLIFILALSFFSSFALISAQPSNLLEMSGRDWSLNVQGLQAGQNGAAVIIPIDSESAELTYNFTSTSDIRPNGFLNFIIAFNGLRTYKQSALDQELTVGDKYDFINSTHALNNGSVVNYRPLNMVNSHAVYTDAGEKVAHISRAKLIDANNSEVYVDTDILGNVFRVYLPVSWMQTAVYPVMFDPTFGYTTIGGSSAGMFGYVDGSWFTAPDDGNVTDITIYFASGSGNMRLAIYNGTDDALLEESASEAFTSANWNTITGFTQWVNSGDVYYLMAQVDDNGAGTSYDTVSNKEYYVSQGYGAFRPH